MKTPTYISITLLLFCACNNTQTPAVATSTSPASHSPCMAETFNEAKAQGISPHVDSVYMDAVNADSTKCAFKNNQHDFVEAYRGMLGDFIHYLKATDTTFKHKGFSYYNRVYFAADGTINYYLYNQVSGLTPQEETLFKKELNDFIKTYKLPMSAKVPFAQCSPVMVQP